MEPSIETFLENTVKNLFTESSNNPKLNSAIWSLLKKISVLMKDIEKFAEKNDMPIDDLIEAVETYGGGADTKAVLIAALKTL